MALVNNIKTADNVDNLGIFLFCLKTVLSKNLKVPYYLIFDDSFADVFICLLNSENKNIKDYVVFCLINAFNNDRKTIDKFVDKGIILKLHNLIENEKSLSIIENSIWALGNLIGEGIKYRDIVIENEI